MISAVAVVGAHAQVTPGFAVGLRAQLPSLRLTSSGTSYQSTLASGPDGGFAEEEIEIEPDERTPAELGAGVRVEATDALALVADATLRLPTSFSDYEGGPEREYEAAVRLAAGAELAVTDSVLAAAGVGFNQSSVGELEEGGARDDFLVFTGGVGWDSGRTTTNVGAFYLFSDGELVPLGAPMTRAPTTTRAYGVLLGFTYRL